MFGARVCSDVPLLVLDAALDHGNSPPALAVSASLTV